MDAEPWLIGAIAIDGAVISANIVELTLLLKKWHKLDRIEHLLVSLCISDLVAGIVTFAQDAIQLRNIIEYGMVRMTSTVGMIFDCFFFFFVLVSNFHIISIAIERLVAVKFPMKYSIFSTFKCKSLTICLVWTLAVLFAPTITVVSKLFYDQRKLVDHYMSAGILLTACILVFTIYMILVFALVDRERKLQELIPEEMRRQMRDRRTTCFCLLIGFSFVICVLPFTIGLMDKKLYHNSSNLLLSANHLVNPLIYFTKSIFEARRRRASSSTSHLLSTYSTSRGSLSRRSRGGSTSK